MTGRTDGLPAPSRSAAPADAGPAVTPAAAGPGGGDETDREALALTFEAAMASLRRVIAPSLAEFLS